MGVVLVVIIIITSALTPDGGLLNGAEALSMGQRLHSKKQRIVPKSYIYVILLFVH